MKSHQFILEETAPIPTLFLPDYFSLHLLMASWLKHLDSVDASKHADSLPRNGNALKINLFTLPTAFRNIAYSVCYLTLQIILWCKLWTTQIQFHVGRVGLT